MDSVVHSRMSHAVKIKLSRINTSFVAGAFVLAAPPASARAAAAREPAAVRESAAAPSPEDRRFGLASQWVVDVDGLLTVRLGCLGPRWNRFPSHVAIDGFRAIQPVVRGVQPRGVRGHGRHVFRAKGPRTHGGALGEGGYYIVERLELGAEHQRTPEHRHEHRCGPRPLTTLGDAHFGCLVLRRALSAMRA